MRFPKSTAFCAPMSPMAAFHVSTAMNAPGSARYAICGVVARSAEPEQAQAAAVEPERAPAFHGREDDQPEAGRAGVPDGRERKGVDAVERRLADHELAAPGDRGDRGKCRTDERRPPPHTGSNAPRDCGISPSLRSPV